jgi:hypothetical protein
MSSEMTLIVSAAAVVGLVIVMGVVMFFISRASKQASNIAFDGPLPDVLPAEGVPIPVGGVSTGARLRGKTAIGSGSSNTLRPSLTLYEDRFEFKIMGTRHKELSAVRQVDVYGDDNHVKVDFDRGPTFYAFVPNQDALLEMVRFFQRKGLSLGEEAWRLIGQ